MKSIQANPLAPRLLTINRRFDVSIDRLFDAWTKPDLIEQWWGPEVMQTVVKELDLRIGGEFHFEMKSSASGAISKTAGTFTRIERPTRLSFKMTEHCNCDLAPGEEPQLTPTQVDVCFTRNGPSTLMVMTQEGLSSDAIIHRMNGGWSSSFGKLHGPGSSLPH